MSAGTIALVAALAIAAIVAVAIIRRRRTQRSAAIQRFASGGTVATQPELRTHRPFAPINHRDADMGFEPPMRAPVDPTPAPVARKAPPKVEVEVRYRRMAKLPKAPTTAEPVGEWKPEVPNGDLPIFSISRTLVNGKPTSGWEVKRVSPAKPMGRRPTKATATAVPPEVRAKVRKRVGAAQTRREAKRPPRK